MSNPDFDEFFNVATRCPAPYDYQRRLALDTECKSRRIEIPTGLGKTTIISHP
jgi:ERCC4-related helicase